MPILLILLAGLVVVVGSIVWLRLHAFLALTLGALLVASLTPMNNIFQAAISANALRIAEVQDADTATLQSKPKWRAAGNLLYVAPAIIDTEEFGIPTGSLSISDGTTAVYWSAIVHDTDEGIEASGSLTLETVSPGDAVVLHDDAVKAFAGANRSAIERVTLALGEFFGKLAILIVCASIIGRCLLDSGAADRIVRSSLGFVGEKLAPSALMFSGFLLGIPVFFDTVFYLMIPLGKTLRIRTGGNYLLYVLSIVCGATMAHSLVPPTPGPLTVAEMLDVNVGHMMLAGSVVALVAATVGLLWASFLNRRFTLELPPEDSRQLQTTAERPEEELPGLLVSLLPIALPVFLISLNAFVSDGGWIIETLSDKNVALLIAAAIALWVYIRNVSPSKTEMADALQSAVGSAGTILLITCAGGAFGRVLNQTNVASLLRDLPAASPVLLVVAAFLVSTAIRTAQGSATVAMITAAGIFGPLVTGGNAGVAPLYVALAIGCGSKPVAWMNDSGFWIITRMSGMSETEGLKYVSPMTAAMGVAGLATVIAGVLLFPMM